MDKELNTQQALRYNRQILLPGFDLDKQEILLNSKVLQIGAGGLGCASAQYLVSAGVGELTLVDDDVVELTNLQRQVLHGDSDIGKDKVRSAKETLGNQNAGCAINTISKRLDESELIQLLSEHDLVLDCTDNLKTRNLINRASFSTNTPLVSGAAIRMEGQVCSFVPSSGKACYQCLSAFFGEQNLSCVESGVMSPVVGVIGTFQALEAIKVLTGFGKPLLGKLAIFDAMNSEWRQFTIPKKPDCPVCSE